MLNQARPALVMVSFFTVLLGLGYPLVVTGVAQAAFPAQANGSLIRDDDGTIRGSALVGQAFEGAAYLHPRPSAAGDGYDASGSSGTNYGPLSPELATDVAERATEIRTEDGSGVIPADAVTASASGLDPDISPAYARLQARRVAEARGVTMDQVQSIIDARTEEAFLGFIGQPRVNVLLVNRDLDARLPSA